MVIFPCFYNQLQILCQILNVLELLHINISYWIFLVFVIWKGAFSSQYKMCPILWIVKLYWLWFSFPFSFWHCLPNSDVVPAFEPVHGVDNSPHEEVPKPTSAVGLDPCVHRHCGVHCHNPGERWPCRNASECVSLHSGPGSLRNADNMTSQISWVLVCVDSRIWLTKNVISYFFCFLKY